MIPYHHPLHQRDQTLKIATAIFFAFCATLITSELKTDLWFKPPFYKDLLSVDFLGWLTTHKIERAIHIFIIGYLLKEWRFYIVSAIALLEIPEALTYYDNALGYVLHIPVCCDSFTVIVLVYIICKRQ